MTQNLGVPPEIWNANNDAAAIKLLDVGRFGYAYHIDSNSLFAASSPIAKLLQHFKGKSGSLEALSLDELDTAIRQWAAIKSYIDDRPSINDVSLPISQLAISPTLKCNLNCTYCYNYQENEASLIRKMPSLDKQGIKKILQTLNELNLDKKVNIAFIGGEPLLDAKKINYLIRVAKVFSKRRDILLGFLVTTNGITLRKRSVVDLLNEHKIVVSVSIDGPPEWHDEARRTLKNTGSYDTLAASLEYFFENYHSDVRSARATYRLKPGRMIGTYRHLKQIGFNDIAMGSSDFDNLVLDERTKVALFEEMEELISEIRDDLISGRVLRHSLLTEVFINLYVGNAKQVVCGATRNHVAFDVYGGMQACHRYLGNTEYSLSPSDIVNRIESSLIAEITAKGKTKHCHECWARSLCGGECFHVGKEIAKHPTFDLVQGQMCDFKRKAFWEALKAYVYVMENHPEKMPKLVYG